MVANLERDRGRFRIFMFEGFRPTKKGIEIIHDYCLGVITFAETAATTKHANELKIKPIKIKDAPKQMKKMAL